ncbi:PPE family protein [Mycobacterium shimoidei]|uniref:PPE family protein n=1 Tax=Mycobacterium shimoidei TaxID=29313 RepID=UPI0008484DBC|nr:PPE family protein [Mycobacterium shimoidei]MCV7257126.1 PPE family protein [Mycobacterium shimoidei]ODR09951.1 hypothetical protein BHQ16_19255 [Mycobacterium shimoidei]ORW80598.1 hypothetical protein AWC26_12060 [Mycobacterium shimoidei]
MDFGALPPEINSGLMYSGPGSASMMTAASAWDGLAADLHSAAASYMSVVSGLTSGPWQGPASVSMAGAAAHYVTWLIATATLCEQAAAGARAAVAAYEAAFAMTVPPAVVAANRAQLMMLVATNILGQNTPAILLTEAHYGEMWAQDAAAMYGYAATSAVAATLTPFTPPEQATNPAGLADQAAAVAQAASPQLISTVPQVLAGLTSPPSSTSGLLQIAQILSMFDPLSFVNLSTPYTAILATINAGLTQAHRGMTEGPPGLPAPAPGHRPLGSALGAQLGSPTNQLASGFTRVGTPGSVSASAGQAASIGTISVPPSWAASAPAITRLAAASPSTGLGAPTIVESVSSDFVLGETVLASAALRGLGGAAPQNRPAVAAHPPTPDRPKWH